MIDKLRPWSRSEALVQLLAGGVVGACLLWSYWPTFEAISHAWATNPVYSHGYLVPIFALVLLGLRRQKLKGFAPQPDWWGGCGLLFLGSVLRLAGAYYYVPWLESASLLPCLMGLCLLLAGRPYLAWSLPAIAFLFFMMPLPYRLETGMRQPLQRLATQGSAYVLQTFGCPAFAEGNIIVLKGKPMDVSEACSGLSMLLVFFALATGVALIIRRPLWEKSLILLSAVPIAVIANVGRISLTGLLHQMGRNREAELIFHNFAGWLMMPAGLAMMAIELRVFDRLMVAPIARKPLPITFARQFSAPLQSSRRRASKPGHS
jgi:exosortase